MDSNLLDNLVKLFLSKSFRSAMLTFAFFLLLDRQATAVVIDPFEGPMQLLTTDSNTPEAGSSLTDSSILGGEREIELSQSGPPGGESRLLVNELEISGVLDFSLDVETSGTAIVTWDGTNGMNTFEPRGLGGIDLTQGGLHDSLSATVLFDDLPMVLTFSIHSGPAGDMTVAESSLQLPGDIGVGSTQEFLIPFEEFNVISGGSIDFSDVGAIVLTIDQSTPATDFQLGAVKTVPEPSTFILALFGAFTLISFIRKSRRRRA